MKTIVKNIISLGSARILSSLFPIIALPYLISTIGIENYGVIIFALAVVAYLNTFVDFSFAISAVREISKQQGDYNKIISKVLSTKALLLFIALIIGGTVISLVPIFKTESLIFMIILSSLIGNALSPDWFFTGTEKMEYTSILSIVFKTLHATSIFLFINSIDDSWIYAVILSSERFLMAITALIIMRLKFNFKFIKTSLTEIKEQLRSNSSLFANQLLPSLYNNTTTLILGFFFGTAITGVFGIIRKITNLAESVLVIISKVFFPAINRNRSNMNAFKKIQWGLTAVLIASISVSSFFLPYIFEEIDQSIVIPLIIMALGLIGLTLYDIYGRNYFLVQHKDQLVLKNTLIFSFLGFIAAFPTIYWTGLIGAVIIIALTRLAIGSRLFLLYKSSIPS